MNRNLDNFTDLLRLAAAGAFLTVFATQSASAQKTTPTQNKIASKEIIESGKTLFQQQCSFCHGRNLEGGETGPSLIESELIKRDKTGAEIAAVIKNGRPEKGMPKFDLSDTAMAGVVAFINNQLATDATNGKRRGVLPSDLQTGNAGLGKAYFEWQGGCSTCHSPTGDLAHVGSRLIGLKLLQRMLYPKDAKAKAVVILQDGSSSSGEVAYNDEFTIGLRDADGRYRSWSKTSGLKIQMDAPAEAHAELLAKYTDNDIHNLMAYLQTLK
jgi:cytochrome c oxidase cbb3-type subunit 3